MHSASCDIRHRDAVSIAMKRFQTYLLAEEGAQVSLVA